MWSCSILGNKQQVQRNGDKNSGGYCNALLFSEEIERHNLIVCCRESFADAKNRLSLEAVANHPWVVRWNGPVRWKWVELSYSVSGSLSLLVRGFPRTLQEALKRMNCKVLKRSIYLQSVSNQDILYEDGYLILEKILKFCISKTELGLDGLVLRAVYLVEWFLVQFQVPSLFE